MNEEIRVGDTWEETGYRKQRCTVEQVTAYAVFFRQPGLTRGGRRWPICEWRRSSFLQYHRLVERAAAQKDTTP